MGKENIKFKRKSRIQFIIWILEGVLFPTIIIYLFGGFKFSAYDSLYKAIFNINTLSNFLMIASVYQLLIFVLNKNQKSIKQDMILSLIHYCRLLEVTLQLDESNSRKQIELERLLSVTDTFKAGKYLVDEGYVSELNKIREFVVKNIKSRPIKDILDYLKMKIINYEYSYEVLNLEWNNSLLVKLLK